MAFDEPSLVVKPLERGEFILPSELRVSYRLFQHMDRLIVDPRLRGFGRAAARLISGGLRQLPWGGHGLVFEEVGEEIGILGGQGTELVEERLLGLQLLAER